MPVSATAWLRRAPFSAWLSSYVDARGDLAAAALCLGMDPSGIARHVRGQSADRLTPWMRLDAADAVFTAAGEPHMLAILYPQDIEMEDRWCETCHDIVTTGRDHICPWCEDDTTP